MFNIISNKVVQSVAFVLKSHLTMNAANHTTTKYYTSINNSQINNDRNKRNVIFCYYCSYISIHLSRDTYLTSQRHGTALMSLFVFSVIERAIHQLQL